MQASTVDRFSTGGTIVHLWLASLDQVAPLEMERYQSWFTSAEQSQYSKFQSERRCREYSIGRGLARRALSHLCGASPESFVFEADANGKLAPCFPNEAVGLHFSISHTNDVVVCAICGRNPVGVDIERIVARADPLNLAARFFSESEHSVLTALSDSERLDRFFLMWTFKEAHAKAHGLGVLMGTDTTHFNAPRQGAIDAYCWGPQFREAWLASAAAGCHHRLALCLLCENLTPVHVRVECDQTGWASDARDLRWSEGRLRNSRIQT